MGTLPFNILLLYTYVIIVSHSLGAYEGYVDTTSKNVRLCAQTVGSYIDHGEFENITGSIDSVSTCEKETNHCYALWKEDPNNGSAIIMGRGCWVISGTSEDCERSQCLSDRKPSKAMNNTRFCCCSGDLCNMNFTSVYVPVEDDVTTTPASTKEAASDSFVSLIIWIVSGVFICFLIISSGIYWRMKPKKDDVEQGQRDAPPSPQYSLDKLKLLSIIGQGRYGRVWRALIDEQEVAAKVFFCKNFFINERDLYKEAGENPSLLTYLGGGERLAPSGSSDYIMIFNLEKECLQDYLKNHTIDLATLCKMSLGLAKGLAHLHSDLGKSCISHRDVNSRNVLVRHDLSCCICDLGLAVVPKRSENRSLSEAGTLRYMAPEVLEGAVNLRDCESALKQIDVYALGLVLWELGTRCTDLQAAEPQPYAPPFYKEVGDNPSLEQMQTLVNKRKARPLWPSTWKDSAAARLLCETAEDCWDQDAEARLTSLCVEERLLDLPTLRGRILHPIRPPASPTPLINNNHLHDRNIDASVGTIETLLSPSEENCKNSNQLAVCTTPIQPYQGRNPCLERNLLSGSSDSLLVDKSSKHCTGSESQNLITNDFLNFQLNHRATPIPYVQNAVRADPLPGAPKQHNVNVVAQRSKFKWLDLKKFFHNSKRDRSGVLRKDTQVQIGTGKLVNGQGVTTSLLGESDAKRPSSLPLTAASKRETLDVGKSNIAGVSQILKRKNNVSRQQSLEQFAEVFSSTSDLSRLKDPSQRVKTPGDVPPSVRRTRGRAAKESAARFSLYDDRMMSHGQWSSAPDLEPPSVNATTTWSRQGNDVQDRDSVSSF